MALATFADRVYETSVTTGSGDFTLAGAATIHHRTFTAAVGDGNPTYYAIVHRTLAEWEIGIGQVLGATLTRTTVLMNNSGTTSAVNFSAGTKDVFQDMPAERIVSLDTAGLLSLPTTATVGIGTAATSNNGLRIGGTITVSGGANGFGANITPTLVAIANGNNLSFLNITQTGLTPGAYTGLTLRGINIGAASVAGFTSPADPAQISVGVLTGTGATNAYGILISPPTGATNNYLIAHSTPATFNVTAAGAITAGAASFTTGAFSGAVTVTVADAAFAAKWKASTATLRLRPYVDATNGVVLEATDAAEATYKPLTLNGSSVRVLGDGTLALTIASGGAATFAQNLTVGSSAFVVTAATGATTIAGPTQVKDALYLGIANSTQGIAQFYYQSNAASRSWRLLNDSTAFGDFAIRQSTTQSGSTFADVLYFAADKSATLAGSLAITGALTGVTTIAISGAATSQSAGVLCIGNTTQSTVGAAGGASALPATPTGYIKTYIGATQYVIPYYAQA